MTVIIAQTIAELKLEFIGFQLSFKKSSPRRRIVGEKMKIEVVKLNWIKKKKIWSLAFTRCTTSEEKEQ